MGWDSLPLHHCKDDTTSHFGSKTLKNTWFFEYWSLPCCFFTTSLDVYWNHQSPMSARLDGLSVIDFVGDHRAMKLVSICFNQAYFCFHRPAINAQLSRCRFVAASLLVDPVTVMLHQLISR